MKTNIWKKGLSLLLAVVLTGQLLPLRALAETGGEETAGEITDLGWDDSERDSGDDGMLPVLEDYDNAAEIYPQDVSSLTSDAVSGEILSMDQDAENYTPAASQSSSASGEWIGEDAARQAALAHAGLADDGSVQFVHTELDRDDGRTVYEVEFWTGSSEYDYEIDAVTGEVLHYDYDAEYHQASAGSGSTISADDAKAAAFAHAGVAEADVTRLKIDLDEDDGRLEYELEWRVGGTEYECTVDASSGSILHFEIDD